MRSIRSLLVTATKNSTKNHTVQPSNSTPVAPFHSSPASFYPLTPKEQFQYRMANIRYIEAKSRDRKHAFWLLCGLFGLGTLVASSGKENSKESKNELSTTSSVNNTPQGSRVSKKC